MNKYVLSGIILLMSFCQTHSFEFNFDPIDVVFVCHEKDLRTLNLAIDGARKFVKNCGRIIVVSERKLTDNAEWFDEALFPFNKKTITHEIFDNQNDAEAYLNSPENRIGWIYQQILKFYSIFVIPNISSNVLIVCADTIFLKPVSFQDSTTGAGLYNPTHYVYRPYFDHDERVLPGWHQVFPDVSGICHHMFIQRSVANELFNDIKKAHNGQEPWITFCKMVDEEHKKHFFAIPYHCPMCVDYELYFNYVFSKTDAVKLRKLKFLDIAFREFNALKNKGYDYLSCHTYKKSRFFDISFTQD